MSRKIGDGDLKPRRKRSKRDGLGRDGVGFRHDSALSSAVPNYGNLRARADCRDKPRTGPMALGARNCAGANESESALRVERSCHKQASIFEIPSSCWGRPNRLFSRVMSSLAEIRKAIERLAPKERAELRQWLDAQDIEESPEFLAAVDKGIWSAENEPKSSLEDVMKRLEERFGWKLR
jgi:hypothetical protein